MNYSDVQYKYFPTLLLVGLVGTIMSYFGFLWFVNSTEVRFYNQTLHFMIAVFLAWKYHPYRNNYSMSKHDPVIIFAVSLFMIVEYFFEYIISHTPTHTQTHTQPSLQGRA